MASPTAGANAPRQCRFGNRSSHRRGFFHHAGASLALTRPLIPRWRYPDEGPPRVPPESTGARPFKTAPRPRPAQSVAWDPCVRRAVRGPRRERPALTQMILLRLRIGNVTAAWIIASTGVRRSPGAPFKPQASRTRFSFGSPGISPGGTQRFDRCPAHESC